MDTNVRAVNSAVKAAGLGSQPRYAPLIELVKVLAVQMDASGSDGPSARLAGAYLSALKDLGRAAAASVPARAGGDELEAFKMRHRTKSV